VRAASPLRIGYQGSSHHRVVFCRCCCYFCLSITLLSAIYSENGCERAPLRSLLLSFSQFTAACVRVYYFFPPPSQWEKKRAHLFCQEQRASCRHRRRCCCFICVPVSFRIFRLRSQGQSVVPKIFIITSAAPVTLLSLPAPKIPQLAFASSAYTKLIQQTGRWFCLNALSLKIKGVAKTISQTRLYMV